MMGKKRFEESTSPNKYKQTSVTILFVDSVIFIQHLKETCFVFSEGSYNSEATIS